MSEQINIVITDKNFDTKVLNGIVVKSEVNANTISIEFPKIYEGENLENKIFVIKTINANGVYFEEILPKTISDNKIILTWKIGSEYTSVSGDLRVAIFAEGTNYTLGTKTSKIFIENSPQFTAPISPEDVFENYLKEIRVRSESSANSAEQSLKILTDMNSKIVDDFTSTAKDKALSANKGRELNDRINNIVSQTGTSNTEIVDARNSPERNTIYPTLKGRLDAVDGDIAKSKYSAPATATAPIVTLPSTAVKGKLEGSLKGNTLYNAITNGDFANGTDGWTPSSATLTVVNKVLSVTGNGASSTPFVYQNTNLIAGEGFKFFLFARAKIKNANCTSLRLEAIGTGGGGAVVAMGISNPVENTTYNLLGVITLPINASGVVRFRVVSQYLDAATANGKTMEVDGNVGVFAIPITGTPYESWTADQLNNLITGYWEGLGNSKPSRVKSVGKNLFDGNVVGLPSAVEVTKLSENSFKIKPISSIGQTTHNIMPNIKFKPNTMYTLSGYMQESIESVNARLEIIYSDGTLDSLSNPTVSRMAFSKTSQSGKTISKIGYRYSSLGGETTYDTFQINEGSTTLPYEPYTETELFCPVELGSVPNGIADEFTFDGKYIQRTKEYVLQTGDIATYNTAVAVNFDVVTITRTSLTGIKPQTSGVTSLDPKIVIPNFAPNNAMVSSVVDNISQINTYIDTQGYSAAIQLLVPKGTYANLVAAQNALAGTKIRYQLATPVETQYPASNLIAESSGTIYVDNTVKVVKPYTTSIALDVKIKNLTSISKVEGETRSPILLSLVNVAVDRLSATILNASSGDMYELEYETFGATLPTIQYSYPLNLNAQVQGNTEALKSTDKTLQDFINYQKVANLQLDLRIALLEGGH